MDFLNLYHYIIEQLLLESVDRSFIAKLNAEIGVIEGLYRKKDKVHFKNEVKILKKKLIAKLVKENYNSILSKYFPFLRSETKTTDDDFYKKLFNTPEIWETFEKEKFENFIKDVEEAVDYFKVRNNFEFENFKYISKDYLRY